MLLANAANLLGCQTLFPEIQRPVSNSNIKRARYPWLESAMGLLLIRWTVSIYRPDCDSKYRRHWRVRVQCNAFMLLRVSVVSLGQWDTRYRENGELKITTVSMKQRVKYQPQNSLANMGWYYMYGIPSWLFTIVLFRVLIPKACPEVLNLYEEIY